LRRKNAGAKRQHRNEIWPALDLAAFGAILARHANLPPRARVSELSERLPPHRAAHY
jgi:hypothetical protein